MILTASSPVTPAYEDSLRKRYFYKLFTNFSGLLIAGATQALVPRSLGASQYGNFNFLTNFFAQTFDFLDSGVSTGFYSKLSQRPNESNLIKFNWGVLLTISMLLTLLIAAAQSLNLAPRIWPQQSLQFIWMAVIWTFLMKYMTTVGTIVDAYGLTVRGEMARVFQSVVGLAMILILFWLNRLRLTEYFLCEYFLFSALFVLWWKVLKEKSIALLPDQRLSYQKMKSYGKEYYLFATPLMALSLVSLVTGLFDRWYLQKYGGAIQQGFFSLSYQIGAVCFLFSGTMTPLLIREFGKAFGSRNKDLLRTLFMRHIPTLYTIAAFFGVFSAFHASKIGLLLGGQQFHGAANAIAIMSLYPIHQTYGQLSGGLFYATEQVKLYRNIYITALLFGSVATVWLLGPKRHGCLDLGSVGLAIKMVGVQFLAINAQLWFNSRYLHFSFGKLLGHQFYCAAMFAVLALASRFTAEVWISQPIPSLFVSGALYCAVALALAVRFPALFSVTPQDIQRVKDQLRDIFRAGALK